MPCVIGTDLKIFVNLNCLLQIYCNYYIKKKQKEAKIWTLNVNLRSKSHIHQPDETSSCTKTSNELNPIFKYLSSCSLRYGQWWTAHPRLFYQPSLFGSPQALMETKPLWDTTKETNQSKQHVPYKNKSLKHFIEHLEDDITHRHINRAIVPTNFREVRKRSNMIHMAIDTRKHTQLEPIRSHKNFKKMTWGDRFWAWRINTSEWWWYKRFRYQNHRI